MHSIKRENRFFDISPRVVRADQETVIAIRPLFDHVRLRPDAEYVVRYFPTEEFALRSGWPQQGERRFHLVDGALRIPQYFEAEQEHVLRVEEVMGQERRPVGDFRVYSLAEDLYTRRPYRGDLHLHSNRSDGQEAPAYVAGACRRIGLDFMAVTDHRLYQPSLEAQRAYAGVELDLRILPGEEVHPPENPVHIINFGGRFSLNEQFAGADYRTEVGAIMNRLGALPASVDRYQYASCVWCFERIREAGGLGIFCHPYWFTEHRYAPAGALTSYLFQQQPFDAFELIGGYFPDELDSNTLQVARYHEERAGGRQIPIVGSSDAHGCERGALFGWYSTLVLAPSPEPQDLLGSIRELYSVAIEALPDQKVQVFGPFRMVKYTLFLLREVLPQHDELCVEEGRLMLRHVAGDETAAAALKSLKGRTAALLAHIWPA